MGTPKTCAPLWTGTAAGADGEYPVTISSNVAYVVAVTGTVYAFDAAGNTDCSGTPKVCSSLWQYTPTVAQLSGYPVVSGGTLYVTSFSFTGTAMHPGTAGELEAFDANGVTGCSGTPKVCSPLWQTTSPTYASMVPPVVADGAVLVGVAFGPIAAFDASGSTNCSGTPKTCTPMWESSITSTSWGDSLNGVEPLVVGGSILYAVDQNGTIHAFDATGKADCSASICSPLWSSSSSTGVLVSSLMIANGFLYGSGFANGGNNGLVAAYNLPPPTTAVSIPSNNATVSGTQLLDAIASPGVSQVQFELSGGPNNLVDDLIATGNPTYYGWLANWNTRTVRNGTYTLQSVASYGGGVSGTSSPITITVFNPPNAYVVGVTAPQAPFHVTMTPIDTATNTPGQFVTTGTLTPTDVSITPDGSTAYVSDIGNVTPVNLATGVVGTPISTGNVFYPGAMAFTPDGSSAYVVDASGSVLPVNLTTKTVGTPISVCPGALAADIVMSRDGATAYVSCDLNSEVVPIDIATNTTGTPIPTLPGPSGLAITPDGATLYVTNYCSINGETGTCDTVGSTVTPIDLTKPTPQVGTPITVGPKPFSIAINAGGTTAVVLNSDGTVSPIDVATNTAGSPISLNATPTPGLFDIENSIAITPDGSTAYVVDNSNNDVIPIDTATNTAGTPIHAGTYPVAIAMQ
jgi:YVTN family beta-propeller protein